MRKLTALVADRPREAAVAILVLLAIVGVQALVILSQ